MFVLNFIDEVKCVGEYIDFEGLLNVLGSLVMLLLVCLLDGLYEFKYVLLFMVDWLNVYDNK